MIKFFQCKTAAPTSHIKHKWYQLANSFDAL